HARNSTSELAMAGIDNCCVEKLVCIGRLYAHIQVPILLVFYQYPVAYSHNHSFLWPYRVVNN
ncbi:MAG: hypothetical protein AB2541_07400, partial [Candidatus Thiodiazotropha sp.]